MYAPCGAGQGFDRTSQPANQRRLSISSPTARDMLHIPGYRDIIGSGRQCAPATALALDALIVAVRLAELVIKQVVNRATISRTLRVHKARALSAHRCASIRLNT